MAAALAVVTAGGVGIAHAQRRVPQSLVFAAYDTEGGAQEAFDAMRQTQKEGVIRIDSFAVISKDQNGRVRTRSTQRRGARAGAVVGALVGVLGGPAGVAVGAAAGGGLGYLTGSAVGIPRDDINMIKSNLTPGSSALVAVIDERWVLDLERSIRETQVKQVMDRKLAGESEQAPETGTSPSSPAPQETSPRTNP
jgi:uncharacterized membrane protein